MAEQYTPSVAHVREQYAIDAEDHIEGAEKVAEFDRFLARVRRDAAREALGGVMERARKMHVVAMTPASRERHGFVYDVTEGYRDTHYPETED